MSEPLQHALPSVADAAWGNSSLFGEKLCTPAAFLRGAEGRRCAPPAVDVAMPPASQGGADMLGRLSHALCFPSSSLRRERPLDDMQNNHGAVS